MNPISIGVIGCGYWGPNLIRNFAELDLAQLLWICDRDETRLNKIGRRFPQAQTTTNPTHLFNDPRLDAVCIVTPVATHHDCAISALRAGKHVLVEKPFARSVREAEEMVALAEHLNLTLMVDHTFVYTGAVRKIKEIVGGGEASGGDFGELLYFDSVRINLGLFQSDVNVVWDLAPHDLSIMDYIVGHTPVSLTATGSCHVDAGRENIAYVQLRFDNSFIAHFHFNWLSPVKIRRTLIAGSRRMIVYDDIEPTEKVRVYDTGVDAHRTNSTDKEAAYQTLVSYRTGDVWVPKLDATEALRYVCTEFLDAIRERRPPLTDGHAGLRSVRLLEAAQESINSGGKIINLR